MEDIDCSRFKKDHFADFQPHLSLFELEIVWKNACMYVDVVRGEGRVQRMLLVRILFYSVLTDLVRCQRLSQNASWYM